MPPERWAAGEKPWAQLGVVHGPQRAASPGQPGPKRKAAGVLMGVQRKDQGPQGL